jgi:hypothetical protein
VPIFAQHFLTPENLRRIPIRFQIMTQTEILEPFKNQKKTRALPVRKPAKFGQVFSPTMAIFGRGIHNEFEKKQKFESFQAKKCSKEHKSRTALQNLPNGGQTSTAASVYQLENTQPQTSRSKGVIYERFFENFLVAAKKT